MGINQLINNSSGTDWGEYEQFYTTISATAPAANLLYTAYEVQGGGYISKVIGHSVYSRLRITIDGKVIYLGGVSGSGDSAIGILEAIHIIGVNQSNYPLITGVSSSLLTINPSRDFPSASTQENVRPIVLPRPLFFNKSLLVEVGKSSAAATDTRTVVVIGGIKL